MGMNPNIVFRKEFDGTGLLYNTDNGQSFFLNQTSRLICECLEKGLGRAEILACLEEKVEGLPDDIGAVVDGFIQNLEDKGIIESVRK